MIVKRSVVAHRLALEKSIELLARHRDKVKAQLVEVDAELKRLVAMVRAAGPVDDEPRRRKPKLALVPYKRGPRQIALEALTRGKVTSADLAKLTGQTEAAAGQMLSYMLKTKHARRVERGVYEAA